MAADATAGVRLHGQLELAVGVVGRAGEAEAPPVRHAVDHHPDDDVLAGAKAGPGIVGSQRQGDGVGRLVLDADDLGPDLTNHEARVDQLQVPVDAVRGGEAVDEVRGEDASQQAAPAGRQ
jgi:hypothetical protein